MSKLLLPLFSIIALALPPGVGAQITTWAGSYTSVTTVSVPESTHGIDSMLLAMYAYTSGGTLLSQWGDYSAWVTDDAGDVAFSFATAFTGTVYITGPWPSSDTSYGFAPEISTNGLGFGMNHICATEPCRKTLGAVLVADDATYIAWPANAPAGTTHVFMYILDGGVHFGVNAASVPSGAFVYNGVLDLNVSSMPDSSTAIPFADAYVVAAGSSASFGSLTAWDRPDYLACSQQSSPCCPPPPACNCDHRPDPLTIVVDQNEGV
jgi:hypothetical protein